MALSFELMGLGLGGVFFALFVLFFTIVILQKVFPHRGGGGDEDISQK